ncbi:hypothetical protein BGY98DRAFT_619048 [Russula aff. rugulosa BPL654]|nr:hypothetical protein BGY98DRAFT_619048 [Russula aff. rugulosa BPL654]
MPDDDDDDGDADDSPVMQYLRHDSLKGKTEPESCLVPRSKREVPEIDYRSHLHHSGSQPTSSPTHPVSADRHTKPHASGSRVASSSSSFTRQSPNPRKRIKVDVQSTAASSPVLGAFTPRSDSDLSHSRALHSRVQPPTPLLPAPPYQPGYFAGFTPHVSPTTVPSSAGGALHIPTSFPSPTVAGPGSGAPPLPLLPPYGSPRHPPRITQPHFGPSTDDLFANVFGPAGGSGVGLDPEFDFLAPPPLTFEWPQFAPATQAAAGGNGQQGHSGSPVASGAGGDSGSSWLDFLSGATSDAPRSPRTGKRSRGDAPGDTGEGHARDAAGGNGSG